MKTACIALLTVAALATPVSSFGQGTPVGLWKTVDDETKQDKSHVRIADAGGVLSGRIEKVLEPNLADAKCEKCEGERKDKKVVGMTILEGVKRDAGHEHWDGGTILDPNNGKVYRVRLTPKDGGKLLVVRGYIGTPMLGRSQTWVRLE